ncbi:uncharacterized protein LOC126656164 [Mercurialis annua]|uniref:uncharacterized protein LOC126656164 n=1 Tax=Mercurialis annua TaxID=3986 RepID=UPI00215E2361|nr:uncharacterized protein LOC126656164 [Mercurialis annua]
MGNCLFGGLGDDDANNGVIKVLTPNGGVMEFSEPITAGRITNEFPNHAIYPSYDLFWKPLPLHENLLPAQSYFLLPIINSHAKTGHVRSKSASNSFTPYRMSFDHQGMAKRSAPAGGLSSSRSYSGKNGGVGYSGGGDGFWKVKLVISREQLLEILSEDDQTHELMENLRAVAKCGNNGSLSSSSSSGGGGGGGGGGYSSSDQWSLSSSRNGSKRDGLLEI